MNIVREGKDPGQAVYEVLEHRRRLSVEEVALLPDGEGLPQGDVRARGFGAGLLLVALAT